MKNLVGIAGGERAGERELLDQVHEQLHEGHHSVAARPHLALQRRAHRHRVRQ